MAGPPLASYGGQAAANSTEAAGLESKPNGRRREVQKSRFYADGAGAST